MTPAPPPTPAAQEDALVAAYTLIPDLRERLAAVTADSHDANPWAQGSPPDIERWSVQGCASPVWIASHITDGRLTLAWNAGSPIVAGLVSLVCRVFQSTTPAAAIAHRLRIIERLELDRILSPTRLHGIASVAHFMQTSRFPQTDSQIC
jgi:cysteine desulfuration protein SufE